MLGVGEEVADNGQGPRFGGGRAHPHDDPGADQHGSGGGQGTEEGTSGEHTEPAEHHLAPPEAVRKRTGDEHQAREGEGITVDHPLQGADAGVQAGLDIRQCHAYHRRVQESHKQHGTNRSEGEVTAEAAALLSHLPDRLGRAKRSTSLQAPTSWREG